jgi:hypothetical protein
MILQTLVGASLVVAVAVESGKSVTSRMPAETTVQQKHVIMDPLVRAANECVLRAVNADPRMKSGDQPDIREVIISVMPSCADRMRAMIDAHDQLYGEGSGEIFFMGPYLDTLPAAVIKAVKNLNQ